MRTLTTLLLAAISAFAQNTDVGNYVRTHDAAIFREFNGLLAIPNVHGDIPNLKKNAEYLRDMLTRRGMNPEIWQETPAVAPTVFAEKLVPGAKRTILFYIHFDGQPIDRAR